MKNIRNKIGDILREGLLENRFEEFEFYVFEKSFSYAPLFDIPEETKNRVLGKLEELRLEKINMKNKFENINNANYFGEVLDSFIKYYNVDSRFMISNYNFKYDELKNIITNKVNITTLDEKPFAKFLKNIKASFEDSSKLISKTYKLFCIEPVYKESMARFKPGESFLVKEKSMKKGFNELMLLADKSKELKINTDCKKSENELEEFIHKFEKEYHHE